MRTTKLSRQGFTLLEMMLVLTIIVIVGAMAVPLFTGTLNKERLRKGIELVATDWVSTRATAMETGQTQVWICQIGSASYSAATYDNSGGGSPTDAASLVATTTGLTAVDPTATADDFGQSMPNGVSIKEVLVTEGDSILAMSQLSTSTDSANPTIFFYPDGTSSSARLTVTDEDQRTMTCVMNGLAGTVRVLSEVGNGADQ